MSNATVADRGREQPTPWHGRPVADTLAALGSQVDGLGSAEAAARLARHGPNALPRARRDGALRLLLRQVQSPLIWILLGAATLAIALGKTLDGLVVLGVVVANAAIGFVQEYRAGRAIEALLELVPEQATALRDGRPSTVSAAELVPGDVVLVRSGDKVPADLRLLEASSLQVDEALLTGESLPVEKNAEPVERDAAVAERTSIVFGSTLVTYGTGSGVVVATGLETELGRISSLLERAGHGGTPLTRAMGRVARRLTIAIGAVAVLLFAVGLLRGYPAGDSVLAAIALAVGAIPEALPAVVTIALAIGVQRMARRRAIVRRLPAVETLGSTTVICTDKTGTLTRNEMTVQELWTPIGNYRLRGVGYAPAGELERDGAILASPPDDLRELCRAALLCNDSRMVFEDNSWRVEGDPTEGALVVAAAKVGLDPEATREAWIRGDAIPFESERRLMVTLNVGPCGRSVAYLKGAPEAVLQRCTGAEAARVDAEVGRIAANGMRVLAVARRQHDDRRLEESELESGFELLGLVGMIDPPRPEAIEAVAACHRAGISVKMITGDHPATAEAIAGELGLPEGCGAAVTGREIERLSDEALVGVAARTSVFARVAPEHKLRLVSALQTSGEIVAMTGDGVNDAPALKQADVGVAMGLSGTSVSKEAAEVVLTDDNFASIAAAVEEGRRVFDNLVKALAFLLPTNLGFALVILISVLAFPLVNGEPLHALAPVQLLWINLVAAPLLSLPLALEVPERDVMSRPPRPPRTPILSHFLLVRTAIFAALMAAGAIGVFLFEYYKETGRGVDHHVALGEAQTIAVTAVILFQSLFLIQSRSLRSSVLTVGLWTNPAVYAGIGALLVLQLGFVYLPFMNELFGSTPLEPHAWAAAVAASLLVFGSVALEVVVRKVGCAQAG
jgi:magnesium-transporting ATPase (P-type)